MHGRYVDHRRGARNYRCGKKDMYIFLEAAGVPNSAPFGKNWISDRKNRETIGKLSKTSRRKFEFALEKAQWDIV